LKAFQGNRKGGDSQENVKGPLFLCHAFDMTSCIVGDEKERNPEGFRIWVRKEEVPGGRKSIPPGV
jgi:hypothetical protein